ncbi:hypothetical protein [Roseinatronobacter monicus]|uniref:hypothetical protein n=1 Tax=Roseinatronobacter monicus TaxID=393481 RepID=UPI001BAB04F3|nr:hypothetical protein [Roseinatronobacter monicus]
MAEHESSDALSQPDGPAEIIQTNYQIGQNNIRPFGLDIHGQVFLISGLSIVAFVIGTLAFQNQAGPAKTPRRAAGNRCLQHMFSNFDRPNYRSKSWGGLSACASFHWFCACS